MFESGMIRSVQRWISRRVEGPVQDPAPESRAHATQTTHDTQRRLLKRIEERAGDLRSEARAYADEQASVLVSSLRASTKYHTETIAQLRKDLNDTLEQRLALLKHDILGEMRTSLPRNH